MVDLRRDSTRRIRTGNLIGAWTFLIGFILAIVFGFLGSLSPTIVWILVIVGLVVGLLNIADEEAEPFLFSGLVLIVASAFGQVGIGEIARLENVLNAILLIFVPATIIVAIKNVFGLARR